MNNYGYEHLKFSTSTYRQRRLLLVTACIAILIFEYNITKDFDFYNLTIPNALLKFGIIASAIWTTIQFIFRSIDDYIEWKTLWLINGKGRQKDVNAKRTLLIEIDSISKGQIKYSSNIGASTDPNMISAVKALESRLDTNISRLELSLNADKKSIEQFQKWYRNFGWFTIIRFWVIEFSLPLLVIIYAVLICRFCPILPK